MTTVTTFLICLLSWRIGPALTHNKGMPLILANVMAACLFNQVVNTASRVFQTYERMAYSSALLVLTNATRLGAHFSLSDGSPLYGHGMGCGLDDACAMPFLVAVVLAQRMAGGIAFAPQLI